MEEYTCSNGNEWKTVPLKSRHKKIASKRTSLKKIPDKYSNLLSEDLQLDVDKELFIERIVATSSKLRGCSSYERILSAVLSFEINFENLICIGIGNFTLVTNSFIQFLFALCFADDIKNVQMTTIGSFLGVFDPIMTDSELDICKHFDIQSQGEIDSYVTTHCIQRESQDHHMVSFQALKVIYFMPHCPYALYCKLLWLNWNNLSNVVIIGNR